MFKNKLNEKTFIKEIATEKQFREDKNFLNAISILNKREIETVKFHKNNEYITSTEQFPIRGDIRISFEYLDLDKDVEVTILAKQDGKEFKEYELDSADPIYQIYKKEENVTTKDALIKKLEQGGNDAKIGMIAILVIVIIVGFFVFRKKSESVLSNEELTEVEKELLDKED